MTRSRQWKKATRATLLGWAAAFAVTLPVQSVEVLRNSGSNLPLLLSALGYGFTVWLLLTLAAIAAAWLCVVTPVAFFVPGAWLLRRPSAVVIASICLGVIAAGCRIHIGARFYHDSVGLMNFWGYILFAAVFSGVTSHRYLYWLSQDNQMNATK